MTGYGRFRACRDGREMTVEIKTVNHRFLDVSFRLPKNLTFLEDTLRELINQSNLKRGHVDVVVTYQNLRADAREVTLDQNLLTAFLEAMKQVNMKQNNLKRASLTEVLELSGALTIAQAQEDTDEVTVLAAEAAANALTAVLDMREREGAHLCEDLLTNLSELEAIHARIANRAPCVPQEYRNRLSARLEEWQLTTVDPQRIAQEVALMADRCAIDEELSRLLSHLAQFHESVHKGVEVGRKLDFLLQEMNREVNTIGSKATDAEMAQLVVEAKCVIEKLREQVQNAV
ncbi:MAG: YicC/YloC family endoribonuclease [Clostridia bacterium]